MAERLTLEAEVQAVLVHIDNNDDFLLSGGAGSGKTYSLVQVIRQVIEENPNRRIACLTYTNSAVKEIDERVNHKNLVVSTIHDFLWDNIKNFQKELKASLIILMNTEDSGIRNPEDGVVPNEYFDYDNCSIQYKEYLKIKDGIISHDEVLVVANYLFGNYPKLCDILKDKFNFIFIDEYQDTNKSFIEILLRYLKQGQKKNIIGFFGDAMQSIYDDGIGNLDEYKGEEKGKVKEVKKQQNRRSPQLVINLANKIRTDGILQVQSSDLKAPNMERGAIKSGNIKFYYSSDANIEKVKAKTGWTFDDAKRVKILNLTHNLIAPKAGFQNLMEIYDRDPVVGLKNDILKNIKLAKKNGDSEIEINEDDTFDEVVNKFKLKNRSKELKKDVLLQDPCNSTLYDQLRNLPFVVVRKIYLNKDQLIDDKKQDSTDENKKGSQRDDLMKHLFKIQNNIFLYENGQFNEFIRVTEYKIFSIEDKIRLKSQIEKLKEIGNMTIEEVIENADEFGICKKDEKLARFISNSEYVFNRVKKIKFSEFQNLYNYLEGYTPYSTQHKIKGTEFDNVLVVLDNGGWNNYNFVGLFENNSSPRVAERTAKIFYVCCTRAKENLAVFFHNPSEKVIAKSKEWFGEGNVLQI